MGLELIVAPRLSNTKAWYTLCSYGNASPFYRAVQQGPAFVQLTSPTDTNVFMNRQLLFGVDTKESPVWGPPFLSFRSGV
jgi:phage major head subunit gpT-like protein